jgi:hypothetical protein
MIQLGMQTTHQNHLFSSRVRASINKGLGASLHSYS